MAREPTIEVLREYLTNARSHAESKYAPVCLLGMGTWGKCFSVNPELSRLSLQEGQQPSFTIDGCIFVCDARVPEGVATFVAGTADGVVHHRYNGLAYLAI